MGLHVTNGERGRPPRTATLKAREIRPGSYTAQLIVPFGVLGVRTAEESVIRIDYLSRSAKALAPRDALSEQICREIERYLDDSRYRFNIPVRITGTEFQCKAWKAISRIPAGSTQSYVAIARQLGTAPRPVGAACAANPIALVIPCHPPRHLMASEASIIGSADITLSSSDGCYGMKG